MSEVKVFKVTGKITKPNLKTEFRKEVRALKEEDAIEEVYKELGSKHRVKRFHIKIIKVESIPLDEVEREDITKISKEKISYVKGK